MVSFTGPLLVGQLTLTTLMELVLHMVPPPHNQHIWTFAITPMKHAPVSLGVLVEAVFPHLWARTTSVSQAKLSGLGSMVFSTQTVTPCGTVRGVVPLAPVVPSTHHYSSMYNYPPPQLMT